MHESIFLLYFDVERYTVIQRLFTQRSRRENVSWRILVAPFSHSSRASLNFPFAFTVTLLELRPRSFKGVIGGFELLSLDEAVEVMLEEACFRRASGTPPDFVPLASKRNSSEWLAAAVETGRVCVMKPLMRPKTVARSWSHYLRVQ